MATIVLYVSTLVNLVYTQSLYPLLDQAIAEAWQTLFSVNDEGLFTRVQSGLENSMALQAGAMTGALSVNVGSFGVGKFILG